MANVVIKSAETESRGELASLLEANTDRLLTCVHCGLCLPACPTYRQLGNENDSPRGRIYLMRGVVEAKVGVGKSFTTHIDLCLGCRGCETVCPSGVPYGHLLEAARAEVSKHKLASGSMSERLQRFILNKIFTRPKLLRSLLSFVRFFRDSALATFLFRLDFLSFRLRFPLALLLASRPRIARSKKTAATNRIGEAIKVALLKGCIMDGLFRETNHATERVLIQNGCSVVEVSGQGCCGALHSHAGQVDTARLLARRNIEAFLRNDPERIIVNAAGCGAAMKEYASLLADDPFFADRAREFSAKVRDISEFLTERGVEPPTKRIERKVTYDAPCHLIHAQRISQAPVELLNAIPGLTLVPLRGSESCCGGAGIYNLQHPDLSTDILNEKMENIDETKADTVASSNPGCIMQIGAGALIKGLSVDVVHTVELLDAAYDQ
ncbi:MAG TPA: heterodisulfide reductase-related iron-sulfur binding cluster [Blastocatellia bacterium]|nr:heterodisulfide reductase-related iron-sulfur binding cluster [Blastocatellia bacterium]